VRLPLVLALASVVACPAAFAQEPPADTVPQPQARVRFWSHYLENPHWVSGTLVRTTSDFGTCLAVLSDEDGIGHFVASIDSVQMEVAAPAGQPGAPAARRWRTVSLVALQRTDGTCTAYRSPPRPEPTRLPN
jgi:hypothetical protein